MRKIRKMSREETLTQGQAHQDWLRMDRLWRADWCHRSGGCDKEEARRNAKKEWRDLTPELRERLASERATTNKHKETKDGKQKTKI